MPYVHGPGTLLSVYYRLSLVLLLTLRLSLSSLPNVLPFKPSSLLSKAYIWSNAHPKLTCLIFLFHLNSELTLPLAELLLDVPASLQFHRQVSASSFHRICCLHPRPHHHGLILPTRELQVSITPRTRIETVHMRARLTMPGNTAPEQCPSFLHLHKSCI